MFEAVPVLMGEKSPGAPRGPSTQGGAAREGGAQVVTGCFWLGWLREGLALEIFKCGASLALLAPTHSVTMYVLGPAGSAPNTPVSFVSVLSTQ